MTEPVGPEEVAERVFRSGVQASLPEWTVHLGQARTTPEGHRVIPVELQRGDDRRFVDAYVWGEPRVGQMDPETSAAIAIASVGEKVYKQQSPHH
jgi:hypothetical protein